MQLQDVLGPDDSQREPEPSHGSVERQEGRKQELVASSPVDDEKGQMRHGNDGEHGDKDRGRSHVLAGWIVAELRHLLALDIVHEELRDVVGAGDTEKRRGHPNELCDTGTICGPVCLCFDELCDCG